MGTSFSKRMHFENLPPSRIEETEDGDITTTYIAWSRPNEGSRALQACVIMRVTEDAADNTTDIDFAEGNCFFDKSWASRADYDYYPLDFSQREQ